MSENIVVLIQLLTIVILLLLLRDIVKQNKKLDEILEFGKEGDKK